jgi:hypothetical protein
MRVSTSDFAGVVRCGLGGSRGGVHHILAQKGCSVRRGCVSACQPHSRSTVLSVAPPDGLLDSRLTAELTRALSSHPPSQSQISLLQQLLMHAGELACCAMSARTS